MTGDHPGQIIALPRPAHLSWVPLRDRIPVLMVVVKGCGEAILKDTGL
jgi:hypothetical protein